MFDGQGNYIIYCFSLMFDDTSKFDKLIQKLIISYAYN